MPTNTDRRYELADAAVTVIGRDGMRALTHRAVDAEAQVPTGTTSNYYRSRAALIEAAAVVALDRLTVESPAEPRASTVDALVRTLAAVVEQSVDDEVATLAWFELRLHAAREREGFVADLVAGRHAATLALATAHGLPGSDDDHRRVTDALDGIVLAAVSGTLTREDAVRDTQAVVRGLVGGRPGGIRGLFGR